MDRLRQSLLEALGSSLLDSLGDLALASGVGLRLGAVGIGVVDRVYMAGSANDPMHADCCKSDLPGTAFSTPAGSFSWALPGTTESLTGSVAWDALVEDMLLVGIGGLFVGLWDDVVQC